MLTTQHYQNLKQPGHKKLFLLRLFPLCITLRTFEPSIEKILESILFFKSQNNFLTKTNQLPTGVFKNFEITKHPSKPTVFLPLMNAIGDPPSYVGYFHKYRKVMSASTIYSSKTGTTIFTIGSSLRYVAIFIPQCGSLAGNASQRN